MAAPQPTRRITAEQLQNMEILPLEDVPTAPGNHAICQAFGIEAYPGVAFAIFFPPVPHTTYDRLIYQKDYPVWNGFPENVYLEAPRRIASPEEPFPSGVSGLIGRAGTWRIDYMDHLKVLSNGRPIFVAFIKHNGGRSMRIYIVVCAVGSTIDPNLTLFGDDDDAAEEEDDNGNATKENKHPAV